MFNFLNLFKSKATPYRIPKTHIVKRNYDIVKAFKAWRRPCVFIIKGKDIKKGDFIQAILSDASIDLEVLFKVENIKDLKNQRLQCKLKFVQSRKCRSCNKIYYLESVHDLCPICKV